MAELPVLVVSCDRYADLWPPFFELFLRRWRERSAPLYLGTNFARYADPRVQTLTIGEDVTWAGNFHRMLDRVAGDFVIVLLEDFLLTKDVDNARIAQLAEIAIAEQLGCLRLYSILPPERTVEGHPGLGWFAPGERYRITAQAAIWRVQTLRQLLVPGFSAWDFELVGSQISDYMPDRIWGVMEPAVVYDHAVEKGKWRPQELAICRQAGIVPDLTRRGAFSPRELERHEHSGIAAAQAGERRSRAVLRFRAGRRRDGLSDVWECLKRQPASLQLWSIAAAGLLGPRAITALHRLHLRIKLANAGRTYRRALRARGPAAAAPVPRRGPEVHKG